MIADTFPSTYATSTDFIESFDIRYITCTCTSTEQNNRHDGLAEFLKQLEKDHKIQQAKSGWFNPDKVKIIKTPKYKYVENKIRNCLPIKIRKD